MRNIDEQSVTDAFISHLSECDSPRFKEILTSLVKHLHGFAREVRLTPDEWLNGIKFLTATGQLRDETRQEFILLSDTLGLSMLVVTMNEKRAKKDVTESTVLGPFYVANAPERSPGSNIAEGSSGLPLEVNITVRSTDGHPLAGAEVNAWQADDDGLYDVQRSKAGEYRARALMRTDASGRLNFHTVLPKAYPVPTDGPVGRMLMASGRHPWRPAHLHFMIRADGHETLVTHLFREGDPFLDSDVVFGVRSGLVVKMQDAQGTGVLCHDFVLQSNKACHDGTSGAMLNKSAE
ncbi:dioxygenase [Methylibium sp. Root1272]|uniref:dioxygenase family protein n=1 Tax=Methylibium sp. Root1272 TaxID=1736441 RepID=UPI0006FEF2D8|nr:dioxygenase [Methylibium sp. Root1272]KQW69872.1 hydroxyquinol 1,2-dioxygenase [Methylibium sp. Root1272]